MRVAIFSDIHGKLLLPFKLAALYQKETGRKLHAILQCGDLGAYPRIETLDKATIKHAQYDRDELGFHDDFTKADPKIASFLDELGLNMICVRGNHEDHDFLDELETQSTASRFPIDAYHRVWLCKSGLPQELNVGDETLRFAGVGRIGDRKGRSEKRFIQDYERQALKQLYKTKADFDVLITHDKGGSLAGDYGMSEIRELLDHVIFHWHFYGHTGEPFKEETDDNGITRSVKVKELEFDEAGVLPEGCMLILEKKSEGEFELEVVSRQVTNQLSKHNWKYD
jgi:predicted phosphodiesterase